MAGDSGGRDGSNDAGTSDGLEGAIGRRLLPGFVRRRYAAKFALSLLLVVLIIGGLGLLSYYQIQYIIEDDAEATLRSTATLQADSLAEWVSSMETQTRAVASSDVFTAGDRERTRTYLRESEAVVGSDVVGLHYVDVTNDTIVASTQPPLEGKSPTAISPALGEPIAAAAADPGAVGMSESAYERDGNLSMAFASRVRGGDGVVVLVGDVARDFEQLHQTRNVVTTRVLNAEGKGVLAPRQNNPSDLTDTPAFQTALAGNTTTIDRGNQVVALAPVPRSDWVVSTTAPKSKLYRASDTIGRNVIVLVTVSLVALGVVGVVLGRQTVMPLVRLRERAEAMEAGDLDVDLQTDREDEIGRLFASFGNMRDALREQIEEAERARQEAEASRRELARQNERLDHFASTVSHDLRNPLTVARGNLELLASWADATTDRLAEDDGVRTSRDDGKDPGQLVDQIGGAHERIDSIIDDVLALARGGQRIEETTETDLAAAVQDAWDTVDTADATLTVAESRRIEADRDRLLRALENLFRNTIDHVGSTAAVAVGLTDTGFYVADDGPGIPPDRAESVFEYGQTSRERGTGLGLSIVRTIAEAHGWSVTIDTDFDNGTRIVFSDVFEAE